LPSNKLGNNIVSKRVIFPHMHGHVAFPKLWFAWQCT
jgi:hypothetical protein